MLPVCINIRCCSSECVGIVRINKDEADESVVLVAFRRHVANAFFLKHSEEDRLSSNHVESGNMPSDI